MSFWEGNRDAGRFEEPAAEVRIDERRAVEVRKLIEHKANAVSMDSLDLAEALAEAKNENYHRVWKFGSFDAYIEQAELGIGKRQAYYLVNIWDGAEKLTIPRAELEFAGISKLKHIFTLDIEQFEPEIRELVKDAPGLTVEEVAERVKLLKQPEEDEYTWRNFKLKRDDDQQFVAPALEQVSAVVGEDMSDGEKLVHLCTSFTQDPNNTPEDGIPVGTIEAPQDEVEVGGQA